MKNIILSILVLMIINNTHVMLASQPKCPLLSGAVVINGVTEPHTHPGITLWFNGNKDSIKINPTLVKKLQEAPNNSPVTCLTTNLVHEDQKPTGIIISTDMMMSRIKKILISNPITPSDPVENDKIYAINLYSPRALYEQAESQQRESLDEAEIKKIDSDWWAARAATRIDESSSYLRPLALLTCLSVAVALYLFWRSR